MSNSFYNVSGSPVTGSAGSSAVIRSEYALIAAGFDKMPLLTASTIVGVNSGGTALTNYTTTGTGTVAVLATAPSLTTPAITGDSTFRSGASGTKLQVLLGRTSDESVLGVASSANDFFTTWSATAGDVVLKDTSGAIWLYAGTDINAIIPNSSKLFRVGNATGASLISLSGDGSSLAFPAVGTTASAANAYLDNGASPANNLLRSTSSSAYKTNVRALALDALANNSVSVGQAIGGKPEQISVIDSLNPVTYTSLAAADDPNRQFIGMIAEDVATIMPSLVTYTKMRSLVKSDPRYDANADPETDLPESVQYERLSVILLAEVQSLRARVAALEAGTP